MSLKKSQLKELTTIYVPSPLEQIQDNQLKICKELKEIKDKQEKVSKWKHKHQNDFPQMVSFLKKDLPKMKRFLKKDVPLIQTFLNKDLLLIKGFLKNTLFEISELKTIIEGREWRKSK